MLAVFEETAGVLYLCLRNEVILFTTMPGWLRIVLDAYPTRESVSLAVVSVTLKADAAAFSDSF